MLNGKVTIRGLAFDKNLYFATNADSIIYFLTLFRSHIAGEFGDNFVRVENIVTERTKKWQNKGSLGSLFGGKLVTVLAER